MKKLYLIFAVFIIYGGVVNAQNEGESKQYISIFADFQEIGITKDKFIERFGMPLSKEIFIEREENNPTEILQYIETFDKGAIIVVTKFTFKNSKLIQQKGEVIPNKYDEGILKEILNKLSILQIEISLKK